MPEWPNSTVRQDPREPEFVQNPYAFYHQLHQRRGPVFWQDYGFWCLADFAGIDAVLRDRRFARLPPPGSEPRIWPEHLADFARVERYSLLSLEPPAHTRLRRRVNRVFMSRQVKSLAPTIAERAHACIDRIHDRGRADLLLDYATPIPVAVIAHLLGVDEEAGPQLVDWSHAMVRVYTLTQTVEEERLANSAAAQFREYLLQRMAEKRRRPGQDLLSELAHDTAEDVLQDDEVISIAILLLNAGHEATVHQLGNAILTLLRHYPPGEARRTLCRLLSDDRRADALVGECLRHDAPLHLFTRYAQQQVVLENGPCLQAGETVGLLLAAGNRCPQRFHEPDRFDPERRDPGQLSLGAGLHFCVGAPLARLELRIALQVLFERLPDLVLDGDVAYQDSFHFHGLHALPVRTHPDISP